MPKRKLRKRPAPPTVALDDAALARGARRVIAFRQAHSTRRGGRRYPMTQEALARRARVSPNCLAGFENGRRRTGVPRLRRIAEAIGLTLEQLVAPEPATTGVPELGDEALMIARLYTIAETDLRVAVRDRLCLYVLRRRDAPAVELVATLKAAGAWPAIKSRPMSDRHGRLLQAIYAALPTIDEDRMLYLAGLVLSVEDQPAASAEPPARAVNHTRDRE